MANFKRRYPRTRSIGAIRGSITSWRARHGLKPARAPKRTEDISLEEWLSMWRARAAHGNTGQRIAGHHSPMNSYPAWWDRMFHTRPARAKNRATLRGIMIGTVDPDEAFWRDGRRPHIYYW